MIDFSVPVLIGLEKTAGGIDVTKVVGEFTRWYEILALSGIIFAISEFMERNKLRTYIFKFTSLSKNLYQLIFLSILTVIIGDLLIPLINIQPFTIPLLHYPAFWEILSLISFTIAMLGIIFLSLFPYKFIPKINHKNCKAFYDNIHRCILNDTSKEALAAVSTILYKNLDTIFKYASKYDKDWNVQGSPLKSPYDFYKVPLKFQNLVAYSYHMIEAVLSNKDYCEYLSKNNLSYVLEIIDKANQYKLWQNCGYVFFNSLAKELFENEDSQLSRELEFRGVGLHKPLFHALFRSLGIIEAYRIFDSISLFNEKNWDVDIVCKYTEALRVAIKEYVKEPRPDIAMGHALYFALEKLPHALTSIFLRIKKIEGDEIYHNKYEEAIRAICRFYGRSQLMVLLIKTDKFEPKYSSDDLGIKDYTMIHGIVKSIFEYLDSLTILQNDQYARLLSTEVFWAIFPVGSGGDAILSKIEDKLLEMIKDRVEENKKGHYPPVMRVLINIYGFQFHSGIGESIKIGQYIEKEFKESFAPKILEDEKFEKKFLPGDCKVIRENGMILDSNGELMFQQIPKS